MNTTYKVGALSKALNSASKKTKKKVQSKESAAEGKAEQVDRAALNSLFTVPTKRPGPLYVPYIKPTQSEGSRKRKRIDGVESEDDDYDKVEKLSATQSQKRKKRWPGKLKMEEMAKNKLEEDKRTVFVGNLSNEMSRKAIAKIFKVYGEIDTIRIRSAALADPMIPRRVGTITRDFHPKRNNLNAYVRFRTVEEAEAALKLNGTLIDKFHIRVDMAEKKAQNHNKRSVFLGNLPFDVEEETIFSHFEDCGDIEGVRLIRDPKTGIGKGFGYVIFKIAEPVELALRLQGSDLDGRELRVSRAVQNPSRNFVLAHNASKVKLKKKHDAKTAKKAMKKSQQTTASSKSSVAQPDDASKPWQGSSAEKVEKIGKKAKGLIGKKTQAGASKKKFRAGNTRKNKKKSTGKHQKK